MPNTLCRGEIMPLVSFYAVLGHVFSSVVVKGEIGLARRISLFGGFSKPLNCLYIVFGHALAFAVTVTEISLSTGIPFFRLVFLLLEQLCCIHATMIVRFD